MIDVTCTLPPPIVAARSPHTSVEATTLSGADPAAAASPPEEQPARPDITTTSTAGRTNSLRFTTRTNLGGQPYNDNHYHYHELAATAPSGAAFKRLSLLPAVDRVVDVGDDEGRKVDLRAL